MKIVALDIATIDSGLAATMGKGLIIQPQHVVVRLTTDDGIEGFAATTVNFGAESVASAVRDLAQLVLGEDPIFVERLWQRFSEVSITVFPPQAIAVLDCALWDIVGKAANMPLFKILGGYRETVPTYASTQTYDSIPDYLTIIDDCRAMGFSAAKLHAWGDPRRDIELCRAVRTHVGSEFTLMLDAVGSYDIPNALRVGRALETLEFEWFEMPIRDQSIAGYQHLADSLDIPVTSGEVHTYGFQEAANYLIPKAWDITRIDAGISGGITGAKKTASLSEGFGVRCELHSFGHSLVQAANLHVIGSIANCHYLEVPLPFDAFRTSAVSAIDIDADGMAHLPSGPGLGITVDWGALEREAAAVNRAD